MINLFLKTKLKLRFFLFFTILSSLVWAQEKNYTIQGNIVDKSTGFGLDGVIVNVIGYSEEAAISDADGNYILHVSLNEGTYTIKANYQNYLSEIKRISLKKNLNVNVDFQISDDLIDLDQVVTTGTGGSVEKRTLGNAISSIKC